ncbi:uncharacterized protein METZ01_LOCUS277430 [marine metagenome]|uniref:Uncharacterized protein n=1 Tax=marine metagenome TaxID=408172 RepID=A0A382KK80_9ZZZZ
MEPQYQINTIPAGVDILNVCWVGNDINDN